jgi:lambda repressor-like predicted transcriptional regulator
MREQVTQGKINKNWFLARMQERHLSMRALSKHLGRDPATMSLVLAGQRRATPSEVNDIAQQLMVPTAEVMRNLGVDVTDGVRRVRLAGVVERNATVTLRRVGEPVIGPADLPHDAVALQYHTVGSDLHHLDGWLAFLSERHGAPELALGCMAVITGVDGVLHMATLERGYQAEKYNLMFAGGRLMENVAVAWASPVLWLKPRG